MSIGQNSRIRKGRVSIKNEFRLIPVLLRRSARTTALAPEAVS
jgi:hypothetical protein